MRLQGLQAHGLMPRTPELGRLYHLVKQALSPSQSTGWQGDSQSAKTYDMEEHRKTQVSCVHLTEKRGVEMNKPRVFLPTLSQIVSSSISLDGVNKVAERHQEYYANCAPSTWKKPSKSGEGASLPVEELIITLQHGHRSSSQQRRAGAIMLVLRPEI